MNIYKTYNLEGKTDYLNASPILNQIITDISNFFNPDVIKERMKPNLIYQMNKDFFEDYMKFKNYDGFLPVLLNNCLKNEVIGYVQYA